MEKEYTEKEKIELINKRMEEVEQVKKELKEKFLELLKEYSYTELEGEDVLDKAFNLLCWERFSKPLCEVDEYTLELAKLVRLFKVCGIENKTYKITSTAKGQTAKVEIGSYLVEELFFFLEREFYKKIYKKEESLESIGEGLHKYGDVATYIKNRFTIESLDKFIEFLEFEKLYKYSETQHTAYKILKLLRDIEELGIKEGKQTRLYSFVYDLLVLRGEKGSKGRGLSGDVGKDKREYIRDCLRSLKKRVMGFDNLNVNFNKMIDKEEIIKKYLYGDFA